MRREAYRLKSFDKGINIRLLYSPFFNRHTKHVDEPSKSEYEYYKIESNQKYYENFFEAYNYQNKEIFENIIDKIVKNENKDVIDIVIVGGGGLYEVKAMCELLRSKKMFDLKVHFTIIDITFWPMGWYHLPQNPDAEFDGLNISIDLVNNDFFNELFYYSENYKQSIIVFARVLLFYELNRPRANPKYKIDYERKKDTNLISEKASLYVNDLIELLNYYKNNYLINIITHIPKMSDVKNPDFSSENKTKVAGESAETKAFNALIYGEIEKNFTPCALSENAYYINVPNQISKSKNLEQFIATDFEIENKKMENNNEEQIYNYCDIHSLDEIKVGDNVMHSKFGRGVVEKIDEIQHTYTIDFKKISYGTKTLSIKLEDIKLAKK